MSVTSFSLGWRYVGVVHRDRDELDVDLAPAVGADEPHPDA